ncbi:MAG: C25 family cysteine peptidase, partial [Ignavibacteriales bacterium]|nr:C25 family cysteine peptidase [Ignavibacteriales bacterium]
MKVFNLLFILIITCLIATPIYSQWISIENYSLPGSNPEVQLISSDETSSIIKVDLPGYMLNHFMYKDKSYYSIDIGEEAITTEVGLPEIPHIAKILAVPDYGSVSVEVIETGTKNVVSGFNIVPARNSWKEGNPETEYIENSDFYKNGNVYPSEIVSVDEPVIFRDFRLVRVSIFPIRYSPSKNEIEAFSSVTVKINYLPGNGANIKTTPQRKIASSFDKIYKTMIFNYDEVIRSRYRIGDETANDLMLCIMPDSYVNTFTAYKDWKILSGMEVVVKKFSEIGATSNTPDVIKNFIADAYHNWQKPPTHILLIGDAGVAPTKNYTSQYDGYTFVNEDYFVEIDG